MDQTQLQCDTRATIVLQIWQNTESDWLAEKDGPIKHTRRDYGGWITGQPAGKACLEASK